MFNFSYKDYDFICDIGTMTPTQYIHMINLLEKYTPKRICEFGSGESTKIFNRYVVDTNSIVQSIEHDSYWNRYNSTMMNLIEDTQLNINNYTYNKCNIYQGFEDWLNIQDCFDFVLIDAPNDGIPTNSMSLKYARIQLLDFILLNKLNDKSIVLYHDSERDIAQNTLNEFERLMKEYNYKYEKEIIIEKDKKIIKYNEDILGVCPQLTIYTILKQ